MKFLDWLKPAEKVDKALFRDIELENLKIKITQMQNDYNSHLIDLNQNIQALNNKLSMRESRKKKSEPEEESDPYENLQPGQKV